MNADKNIHTEEHPAPESAGETSRLIETRRAKAAELRKCGINPYPYRFERTHTAAEALADFEKLSENETEIRVAGRIMLNRDMGKSIFADLHDQSGKLQLYVKIDNVGEGPFGIFGKLDIGDIIGATGTVFVTRKGEKSLRVTGFEVLCKALHPLPDKHAGLTNVETRYRQRYVDLIMSPNVRDVFTMRSKIVQAARDFLFEHTGVPVRAYDDDGGEGTQCADEYERVEIDGEACYRKFASPESITLLVAGGTAGKYSAVLGSWATGPRGSQMVTYPVE